MLRANGRKPKVQPARKWPAKPINCGLSSITGCRPWLPGVTKGDYWVLYLGDDYSTALVGNPDRRYLWLLSRKPHIDQQVRDELLSKAQQQGYDTTRLIWRTPDSEMPKGTK